jgi:hypothetical protein
MRPVSAHLSTIAGLCAVACLTGSPVVFAQTQQTLRVVPIVRAEQVLVSFELANGLTDEVRAAILSGLKTTFTYTVELRMEVPLFVDRTIGTTTINSSVSTSWDCGLTAVPRSRGPRPTRTTSGSG